ncbi:amino acid ABC transporter permease [Nocardioides sp.]|uniref:amino acid ABC transporter permease n=1 Tax=Nocardioides sp. TaxID=35761 RepID=UPI0035299DE2
MQTFIDNFATIWSGFATTLWLLFFSAILSTVMGTLLASFRVSPIPTLRAVGTSYVNVFRNTPLVLILAMTSGVMPILGLKVDIDVGFRTFTSQFVLATLGLSFYTAAFVCEAVRSGVNSVALGQAEAARAIGMGFTLSLREVVLPQAFRAVIPPLTSTYIALAKNTSVVAIFGVPDAAYYMRKLGNQYASDLWFIFIGIAAGYVLIVMAISLAGNLLERRLVVLR